MIEIIFNKLYCIKYKRITVVGLLVLFLFFGFTATVHAIESVTDLIDTTANKAHFDKNEGYFGIIKAIGLVINAVLILLGVFFIVLMVYGGFLWMTARGDNEQVNRARDLIRNTLTGLIIVVGAYAITYFILSIVFSGTTDGGVTGFTPES